MSAEPIAVNAGRFEAVERWLIEGAPPPAPPEQAVARLCERLCDCGLPLHRVAAFVRTLHPYVMGRRFVWRPDRDVDITEAPHSLSDDERFLQSPIPRVIRTGTPIRRRLADPACPDDFSILGELRAEGVTDYLAQPLRFTNGEIHSVTWATRHAGGFTDDHVRHIERILPLFARLAEVFALRRTARNILNTYLGRHTGEKVLQGLIQRGDGIDMHAVIWFCDLRQSTHLAESLSRRAFLDVLNRYFECVAGAVLAHDGEVLRFIGDAVLAIFPIAANDGGDGKVSFGGTTPEVACATALDAARDAMERMAALNAERRAGGEPALGYGIALDRGDVMYGNIGTPERLEFTVVGAAANRAARIESLSRELDVPLLLSAEVAQCLPGSYRSLGRHALRGITGEHEIFTAPDLAP